MEATRHAPTWTLTSLAAGKGRARTYKFEGAQDIQYSHIDVVPVGLPVDTDLDYTSHCWTITGHIYIATTGGIVLRIDPATGASLWHPPKPPAASLTALSQAL